MSMISIRTTAEYQQGKPKKMPPLGIEPRISSLLCRLLVFNYWRRWLKGITHSDAPYHLAIEASMLFGMQCRILFDNIINDKSNELAKGMSTLLDVPLY